jgi:hypothetical protein
MSLIRAAFAALLLLPLALSSAQAEVKHRLALQISDNDPAKMNAVLNVAAKSRSTIPRKAKRSK